MIWFYLYHLSWSLLILIILETTFILKLKIFFHAFYFLGSINVKSNNKKGIEKDIHTLPLPTSLFWSKMNQTFSSALADQINPADLELLDSVLTEIMVNENKESDIKENENENKDDDEDKAVKVRYGIR